MKTASPLKLLKLLLPSLQTQNTKLCIKLDGNNFVLQYNKRTAGWLVYTLSIVEDAGHSTLNGYVVKDTHTLCGAIDKQFCSVYDDIVASTEKLILKHIEDMNKGIQTHIPVRSLVQADLYFEGE